MLLRDGVGLVAVVTAVAVLLALLLVLRARLLARGGGSVECSLRQPYGEVWQPGVSRYDGDALRWYRAFGARLRPDAVVRRRGLSIDVRRCPLGTDSTALHAGHEVLECSTPEGRHLELALPHAAVPGFLAWLESVPPGTHVRA